MRAEIVSIGDELTSGQRLDTNSQWLSQQLSDLGVRVLYHSTVGDDLEANIHVFQTAAKRADMVISTGGLGPTADDLTRQSIATAFNRPLELRQEALEHIQNMFASRKRVMPERNRDQAYFPETSVIIPNPHGTAPGIDILVEGCRLFALPGVPAEMFQMWKETVRPRLIRDFEVGKQQWFYRSLKVFGIGESDVEALLPDLILRDRIPRVGITVSQATITLRIAVLAENEEEAAIQSAATEKEIHDTLGILVYGSGEQEIDEVVHEMLTDRKETVGVIEYGSDCLIGPWLSQYVESNGLNVQESDLSKLENSGFGLTHSTWFQSCDAMKSFWCDSNAVSNSIDSDELMHKKIASIAMQKWGCDWLLIVGPYPSHKSINQSNSMPAADYSITVAHLNENTIGQPEVTFHAAHIAGHPDILFNRIAKTGIDHLRKAMLGAG